MNENKETFWGFVNRHGTEILIFTSIFGAYALGMSVGTRLTEASIECGLQKAFKVNPQIETLLTEAIGTLKKK